METLTNFEGQGKKNKKNTNVLYNISAYTISLVLVDTNSTSGLYEFSFWKVFLRLSMECGTPSNRRSVFCWVQHGLQRWHAFCQVKSRYKRTVFSEVDPHAGRCILGAVHVYNSIFICKQEHPTLHESWDKNIYLWTLTPRESCFKKIWLVT